jgi:hypothetical protein
MKRPFIMLILLFLLLNSCSSKSEGSNNVIHINLDKEDNVSVFDLVDSISVVQLETSQESLIGNIYKIIFHKDRFYLLDFPLQTFFCFNSDGKFLFKMNKRGRGPDEYDYAGDFNIDPFNDQIMILVPWGNILYYDLDGKFISKVKLPSEVIAYHEVYALDAERLLFLSSKEIRANYYSRTSKTIIKRRLDASNGLYNIFGPLHKSYYFNDSLFFNDVSINNDVLNMMDESQKISYSWDFGKNNNTPKQIKNVLLLRQKTDKLHKPFITKENLNDKTFPNYYTYNCYETKRYRITTLRYKDPVKFLYVFKDKIDGGDYVFRKTTEGIDFFYESFNGNSVIMFPNDYYQSFAESTLSAEQLKIVRAYNPDKDNPFLVIYHLKR